LKEWRVSCLSYFFLSGFIIVSPELGHFGLSFLATSKISGFFVCFISFFPPLLAVVLTKGDRVFLA